MLIINDVNLPTDLAYTVSPSVRDFCMSVNICPRNKHQTTLWARVVPWVLWTPSFCQANTSQSNSSPQITNLHYVSTIIHIPVLHQNYRAIQENLSGQNVYKKKIIKALNYNRIKQFFYLKPFICTILLFVTFLTLDFTNCVP